MLLIEWDDYLDDSPGDDDDAGGDDADGDGSSDDADSTDAKKDEADADAEGGKDDWETERAGLLATIKEERGRRQASDKAAADLRASNDERDRKKQEEDGEFQQLYEGQRPELDKLRAENVAYKEANDARQAAVAASNEKRLKALPASYRDLVPESLTDPDAIAAQLLVIEKLEVEETPSGTRTRSKGKKPNIPEECKQEAMRAFDSRRTDKTVEEYIEYFHETIWMSKARVAKREREAANK